MLWIEPPQRLERQGPFAKDLVLHPFANASRDVGRPHGFGFFCPTGCVWPPELRSCQAMSFHGRSNPGIPALAAYGRRRSGFGHARAECGIDGRGTKQVQTAFEVSAVFPAFSDDG